MVEFYFSRKLLKENVAHDGTVVMENSPKEVRSVISAKTSAEMRNIFVGVVDKGTGENAKLDFITVGGKTGTSQKLVNGSYSKSSYNSSFIGFFPADHPKIICLILVNSPEKGKYGGQVAAPIFRNVAERIVNTDVDYFEERPEQKQENFKVVFTSNKQNEKSGFVSRDKSGRTLTSDVNSLLRMKCPIFQITA